MRLGGIVVPHDRHAIGHSDADVLLHAITDALLGAAALGDIGQWFPDTDPANRGRDSGEMLQEVCRKLEGTGYRVINVDCIVFAERPKLGGHKEAIQQRVAQLLDVNPNQVGIKAKTGEQIGPIGEGHAIMAQCVALIEGTDKAARLPR